jgi:hypothetical protein
LSQTTKDEFFKSTRDWICSSYSLSVQYLAVSDQGIFKILDASVFANPLPPINPSTFNITAGNLMAGQEVYPELSKVEILKRLAKAAVGEIEVHGLKLKLASQNPLGFYSETPSRETWFSELHMMVTGAQINGISSNEVANNDAALRSVEPPFDGLFDLCNWLNLKDARATGQASAINLRISPPVDFNFGASTLQDNNFNLALYAHPKFDTKKLNLATKEFPGRGIESRKQVNSFIKWNGIKEGKRSGVLKLKTMNADSLLAMLNIGDRTIRRQWFIDPTKAVNSRYVATQLFDKDLKQLNQSILDATDSNRFEQGIALLLYVMGFSAAVQLETNSPDILVSTPNGTIAVVECTLKISDFQSKVGKLAGRRNALITSLESTRHSVRVDAFLICGKPKEGIAIDTNLLINHKITLLSKEDIQELLSQLRVPKNPDEILDRAAARLAEMRNTVGK